MTDAGDAHKVFNLGSAVGLSWRTLDEEFRLGEFQMLESGPGFQEPAKEVHLPFATLLVLIPNEARQTGWV